MNGTVDYFYEERTDILATYQSRPQWVGVNMAAGNLGSTKNSGYEFELKHNNRIGNDFYYNIGFTFSHAHNEILGMDEPDAKTEYRKRE